MSVYKSAAYIGECALAIYIYTLISDCLYSAPTLCVAAHYLISSKATGNTKVRRRTKIAPFVMAHLPQWFCYGAFCFVVATLVRYRVIVCIWIWHYQLALVTNTRTIHFSQSVCAAMLCMVLIKLVAV